MKIRGLGAVRRASHNLGRLQAAFGRSLIQRLRNPSGDSRPVFLVGAGRSGTSMIVRHLARTWQVALFNEDDPAAFRDYHLRDFAEIRELIGRSRAPITLFKPIKDTHRTRALLSDFPGARILFVFRHYDDVVNSDRRKFYGDDGLVSHPKHNLPADRRPPIVRWIDTGFAALSAAPPPEASKQFVRSRWTDSLNLESNIALHWLFVNRLFFDLDLAEEERVRLVRYETVVADPKNAFAGICRFIGMEFEPRIAEAVFSGSVQRDAPPEIAGHIRADCEALWQQLCAHEGNES